MGRWQTEAEAGFHHALDIARSSQAKSWELDAATNLTRQWQSQDKCEAARELFVPVYHDMENAVLHGQITRIERDDPRGTRFLWPICPSLEAA